MMNHNTIIRIFVVICAVCAVMTLFVTGASAVDLVPEIDFASVDIDDLTGDIPDYNADYMQDVVSGCLAYAYLQSQTIPTTLAPNGYWRSYLIANSASGYQVATGVPAPSEPLYRHFLMVTTDKIGSGAETQGIYIYFAYTAGYSASGVNVDAIPEEWGQTGATFNISSDMRIRGLDVYRVYFDSTGEQMYFEQALPPSAFNFVAPAPDYGYTVQSIALGLTEQIVYARAAIASGWNDMYSYGDATAADTFTPSGAYKWVDAYNAFVNGPGYDQDDIDNAYSNGYTDGFDNGYDDGYDYGYNYGLSLGAGGQIDVGEIISAIPAGAKSIINGALGFEIFGINVAGTLTALLVVAIVAFVVHKFMTR